jgi:hypothetical protein
VDEAHTGAGQDGIHDLVPAERTDMSQPIDTQASEDARRRRWLIIIAVAVVAIVVIVGLAAAWLFFLGSEAPPAPTLDDALQVLQSAAPSE